MTAPNVGAPDSADTDRAQGKEQTDRRDCAAPAGVLTTTAAEINSEHNLACQHAERAIEHARRAGVLLLEAKAKLPHGAFLAWVAANLEVTPRQAQRYMAAALGKPMPVRAIKCDSVSLLESGAEMLRELSKTAPAGSWVHHVAELGLCATQGAILLAGEDEVFIEPARTHGWFYVVKMQDHCARVGHFGRPLNLAGVAIALDMLGVQQLAPRQPLREPFVLGRKFTIDDRDPTRYRNAEEMGLMAAEGTP